MLLSESAALFCENGEFVMDKLDCVEVYERYFLVLCVCLKINKNI